MSEQKICSIGGQALLEGVMMRSPTRMSMVVRKESGELLTKVDPIRPWSEKNRFTKLPIVRGCCSFAESLATSIKTMSYAAKALDLEEEEPSKFEKWLSKTLGKGIDQIVLGVAMVLAVALTVGLFIILPSLIGSAFSKIISSAWATNFIEGLSRMIIFLGYMWLISKMKEIERVYAYHGAEHKTIACYEHGLPLTVENAREQSRLHPRCGTNYMFLVMMISILFFSLLNFSTHWAMKIVVRLACLPIVAGVSYEVLKAAAKGDSLFARIARWPGLQLQHLTTREPDDGMLEVAITAFNLVLDEPAAETNGQAEAEDASGQVEDEPIVDAFSQTPGPAEKL